MSYDNVQIIRAIYAASERNDGAAMFADFDPDIVLYEPAGLPYGGVYRGLADLQQFFAQFMAQWESFRTRADLVVGEGDQVIAQIHISGQLRNGTAIEMPVIEHWTLRDGKVVEVRPFYWDTAALAAALSQG